jgi:cardiolipin synthase
MGNQGERLGPQHRSVPDPILALPNVLTLLRVPLGLLFWVAPASPPWAFGVMSAAALSDMVDGWFARKVREWRWRKHRDPGAFAAGTGVGAFLDPLCDKFFVVSALLAVLWAVQPPALLLAAVAVREILFAPLMLGYRFLPGPWRERGVDFSAGWPGKAATVAQFVALALAILRHSWFEPAAWAAGLLGLLSAAYYVRRALTADDSRTPTGSEDEP